MKHTNHYDFSMVRMISLEEPELNTELVTISI